MKKYLRPTLGILAFSGAVLLTPLLLETLRALLGVPKEQSLFGLTIVLLMGAFWLWKFTEALIEMTLYLKRRSQ